MWDKVKSFADDVAEIFASTITSTILTNVIFSVFDIAVPGLGTAIRIGIAYASSLAGNFAGDQVESAIADGASSTKTQVGFNSNSGDWSYGMHRATQEHPDRYYMIYVEYQDPPSLNEIADIVQGIRSIRNIIKKKIPNVDLPTFPHRIIRKVTIYQHYVEIIEHYRVPKVGGMREVLNVDYISEGMRPISNYEYSDSYYDFVTPGEQSLWIRGRRLMEATRRNLINNPGTAKMYNRLFPYPY